MTALPTLQMGNMIATPNAGTTVAQQNVAINAGWSMTPQGPTNGSTTLSSNSNGIQSSSSYQTGQTTVQGLNAATNGVNNQPGNQGGGTALSTGVGAPATGAIGSAVSTGDTALDAILNASLAYGNPATQTGSAYTSLQDVITATQQNTAAVIGNLQTQSAITASLYVNQLQQLQQQQSNATNQFVSAASAMNPYAHNSPVVAAGVAAIGQKYALLAQNISQNAEQAAAQYTGQEVQATTATNLAIAQAYQATNKDVTTLLTQALDIARQQGNQDQSFRDTYNQEGAALINSGQSGVGQTTVDQLTTMLNPNGNPLQLQYNAQGMPTNSPFSNPNGTLTALGSSLMTSAAAQRLLQGGQIGTTTVNGQTVINPTDLFNYASQLVTNNAQQKLQYGGAQAYARAAELGAQTQNLDIQNSINQGAVQGAQNWMSYTNSLPGGTFSSNLLEQGNQLIAGAGNTASILPSSSAYDSGATSVLNEDVSSINQLRNLSVSTQALDSGGQSDFMDVTKNILTEISNGIGASQAVAAFNPAQMKSLEAGQVGSTIAGLFGNMTQSEASSILGANPADSASMVKSLQSFVGQNAVTKYYSDLQGFAQSYNLTSQVYGIQGAQALLQSSGYAAPTSSGGTGTASAGTAPVTTTTPSGSTPTSFTSSWLSSFPGLSAFVPNISSNGSGYTAQ